MEADERLELANHRDLLDEWRRQLEQLDSKTPNEQEIQLLRHQEEGIAELVIRSGARNALSGRMISQLTELIDELEAAAGQGQPPLGGLLIRGAHGCFCSGSDLVSVKQSASQESGWRLAQLMQFNLMRLQRLPLISVALLEGYALGGGAELALAADLRLMTSQARIGFVHAKVGVCCGWGGGRRLVELAGPARAADLMSSGRLVGADEAMAMGLSNATVEGRAEAVAYLVARAARPPATMAALKGVLNGARLLGAREAYEREARLFAGTWGAPQHLRLLAADLRHAPSGDSQEKAASSRLA